MADGRGKTIFVKTAKNNINFSRNLSAELNEKSLKKMIGGKLDDVSRFENIWKLSVKEAVIYLCEC